MSATSLRHPHAPVNRPGSLLWIGTVAGRRFWSPATKPGQAGRYSPAGPAPPGEAPGSACGAPAPAGPFSRLVDGAAPRTRSGGHAGRGEIGWACALASRKASHERRGRAPWSSPGR